MADQSIPLTSLVDVRDKLDRAAQVADLVRWIESARYVVDALTINRLLDSKAASINPLPLPEWAQPQSNGLDYLMDMQSQLIQEAELSLRPTGGTHV